MLLLIFEMAFSADTLRQSYKFVIKMANKIIEIKLNLKIEIKINLEFFTFIRFNKRLLRENVTTNLFCFNFFKFLMF